MIKLILHFHDRPSLSGTYPGSEARIKLDEARATNMLKDFSLIYVSGRDCDKQP